ncbi:MAG: hypothetical protein WBC50_01490 [Dehalococcoidales bacterium]
MKQYYISMKDEVEYEKQFYSGELKKPDWKPLKEAGVMFLIHAYSHRFQISQVAYKLAERYGADASQFEVFGDADYTMKYSQFYLNLAVGLELLLKAILLKKGEKVNRLLTEKASGELDSEKTIMFGETINRLTKIFPTLSSNTRDEIKDTLMLINLRRNNIAHRSKRSYDSYAHEYRFSYITLYIYEKFFYGENQELTALLLKSIDRSRVTQGVDFESLKIKPRSLRGKGFSYSN